MTKKRVSWLKQTLSKVWNVIQDMEYNYPMSARRRNKIRDYYGIPHEPEDKHGNPIPRNNNRKLG